MVYGYDSRVVNEYGLKQMRELSIAAEPDTLREIAAFLLEAAEELERLPPSGQWHRHASPSIQSALGCDVVVLNSNPKAELHPPI